MQLEGELRPNKVRSELKPSQIKPNKIAWFYLVLYLSQFGLFNGLQGIPNKTHSPVSTAVSRVNPRMLSSACCVAPRARGHGQAPFGQWEYL